MPVTGSSWRVRVLVAAFGLLAAGVRAAEACSCIAPGPPCQEAFRTKAVFVATVVSIEDVGVKLDPADPAQFLSRRVRMRVTEAFTGVAPGDVVVRTGQGGGDCGYPFTRGESYVVYAHDEGNGLVATICSRTKHVRDAAEDLAYLRSFTKAPANEGRLLGQAVYRDPNDLSTGSSSPRPVPDLRIVMQGGARSIEARTGRDGRFEVRAPAGTYRVDVDSPPGTYVDVWPSSVDLLDPRGCATFEVAVRSDGHVLGRVVNTRGEPVPHVPLQIGPPDGVDQRWSATRSGRTDAQGRFDIGRVPPGSYVLGFNLERDFNGRPMPFPRAFLPGVTEPARAEVIRVGPGQRMTTPDFVVPDSIAFTALTGSVLDVEGKPVAGVKIFLKADSESSRLIGEAVETDAKGRFALAVVAGFRYRLLAERVVPGEPPGYARAEIAGFVARAGADPVIMRIPPVK